MNDIYYWIGQGLLTLLSVFIAYKWGQSNERKGYEKERADCVSAAKRARETLRDPDVIDGLHAKYKR